MEVASRIFVMIFFKNRQSICVCQNLLKLPILCGEFEKLVHQLLPTALNVMMNRIRTAFQIIDLDILVNVGR